MCKAKGGPGRATHILDDLVALLAFEVGNEADLQQQRPYVNFNWPYTSRHQAAVLQDSPRMHHALSETPQDHTPPQAASAPGHWLQQEPSADELLVLMGQLRPGRLLTPSLPHLHS